MARRRISFVKYCRITKKFAIIYFLFIFAIVIYALHFLGNLPIDNISNDHLNEAWQPINKIPIVNIFSLNFFPGLEDEVAPCSNKIKIIRSNRQGEYFDAAIVHFTSLSSLISSHKFTGKKKLLILVTLEPPMYMPDITYAKKYFNVLVGGYLRKSRIYLPYGNMEKNKYKSKINLIRLKMEFEKRKSKALAIISHCGAYSNRIDYIHQLNKIYPVDMLGACGTRMITQTEKFQEMQNYKFYLSFENSNCEGYITEKFFEPLCFGAIPVVMGGRNYSHVAISGSYINTRDFYSPIDLGNYLKSVTSDFNIYLNYFKYTETHKCVLPARNLWFDDICEFNQLIHTSIYGNFKYDETVDMISNTSYCFIDKSLI